MAVNFTEPERKNVEVQFEAQSSTEISSKIGGESVTITVSQPNKFKTPKVTDAVELSDILETVDIRYVASTAGYSNGDSVDSWSNSGDLSGYDLSNENKNTSTHPTFDTDDAANPFSDGAMKFVIDASDYNSDYLHWGTDSSRKTLAPSGDFTMYMVMASTSAAAKKSHSPLWIQGVGSQAEDKSQTAVDTFVSPGNPNFLSCRLKGPNFTSTEVDPLATVTISDQRYETSNVSDGIVLVITVDKDGKVVSYNSNSKRSTEATIDSSRSWKADTFGGPDGVNSLLPHDRSTGDTLYVAEFGYWGSKIEGQQAAALGRLLAEKYKVS